MPDALPAVGTIGVDATLVGLTGRLVAEGQCDTRMIERATRVAPDSDQRLDAMLLQLGLVTERGLATALAGMLDLPLVVLEHHPVAELVPVDRLSSQFLRGVRALPPEVAAGRVTMALVDPPRRFHPRRHRCGRGSGGGARCRQPASPRMLPWPEHP